MSEELKQFNIDIEDIKEDNNLFNNIQEAIDKLRIHTLADRFELVLNNNLIEAKEKLTNYRTILGCRITYDNLDKNISFIVREDNKPTYEELEYKYNKQKEIIDKIKEYCNHKLEMLELQKRNIMQILTPENGYLKADIEIEMQKYKDILELLEEIE